MSVRPAVDDLSSLRTTVNETVEAVRNTKSFGSTEELAACVCAALAGSIEPNEGVHLNTIALEAAAQAFAPTVETTVVENAPAVEMPVDPGVATGCGAEAIVDPEPSDVPDAEQGDTDAVATSEPTTDAVPGTNDVAIEPAPSTDAAAGAVDREPVSTTTETMAETEPQPTPDVPGDDSEYLTKPVAAPPLTDDDISSTASHENDMLHAKVGVLMMSNKQLHDQVRHLSFLVESTVPLGREASRALIARHNESWLHPGQQMEKKKERQEAFAPIDFECEVNKLFMQRRGGRQATLAETDVAEGSPVKPSEI
jgi:hypothetical protein